MRYILYCIPRSLQKLRVTANGLHVCVTLFEIIKNNAIFIQVWHMNDVTS